MISLHRAQRFLIYCFVFFGPLGTLLTPSFMPYAFRFYHFLLVLSPIFFINVKMKEWKTVLAFVPFLSYCLFSAYFTHNKAFHRDAYPLFRCFLFVSQCVFMFGAAFCLRTRDEKERLIRLYLAGFFISLVIGYIFYIGFYTGNISFETIHHYSVEAQMGWGLLRFSPGTYPNEYGNISSFVLTTLLLLYARKPRFLTFVFAGLTFIAFLLTTTRAAYLSFIVSMIYLCMTSLPMRKLVAKICFIGLAFLLILKAYSIDFFTIFAKGVKTISLTYGSTGIRFNEWVKGFEDLNAALFLGNGFGSNILAHNVYLEILFEVGLIGSLLLLITLFYYFGEHGHRIRKMLANRTTHAEIIVGMIHILLFAASNHNMHHHLTWFVFLLFNMFLFSDRRDDAVLSSNKRQPSPSILQQQDPLHQE
ncbi:MAG: O-antigen ligase family protein [Chlamydiia bacterium]|nr:O-antigen ligase family protein [Chlamydiia bacterium]